MAKLQRAITGYNSAALSASVRAQILAMAPKYIDGSPDADGAYWRDNLPGAFPLRYFNLTDMPNPGSQLTWSLARAAVNGVPTPESILLHFVADTVVNILGVDYLVPGFGAGSASQLTQARVPVYAAPVLGVFPRVLLNFSTAAIRQTHREYAIENVLTSPYATGKYPLGLWLDNATDTTFNVDAVSMSQEGRGGRDVWGVSVQAGAGTWAATGNYVYRVVPSTALGDGISSTDLPATITTNTQQVRLDWSASGTGTYKVYRKPAAASWTSGDWRVATVTGGATTYTDTGTAPVASSGGPSRAGELVEAPAGMRFLSPEFADWKWNSGHGLWIRELKDLIATGPGWLGGRAAKVVANTANHPGLPTTFGTRYSNFNGTGAPVADAVFREFCGSPIRNYDVAEPFSMYTAFQAAAAAGMDVWETGYNYGVAYPTGTVTTFGRTRTAFDIMAGIIGLAWLVRSSTSMVLGYANTWSPADAEWQHNTWPLWDVDLGTALGPPAVIASGAGWAVYGREFSGGYVTTRFRASSNETMAATMDQPVTLPAGNWLPVVDLNGNTGPQQVGPFQHVNGQSYIFIRAGAAPSDTTPPSTVADLAASSPTQTGCTLTWTAPGDDGPIGQATSYEFRRHSAPITAGTWAAAVPITGAPAPAVAGTAQAATVTGLTAGTTYYFAMRATDEAGNVGGISNSPQLTTASPAPDITAPAKVTDLALINLTTTGMTARWTAPGDDGAAGTATSYELRYSTSPLMDAAAAPIVANGSLYPAAAAQVTANFFQDIPSLAPATAAALAIGETLPILHFIPPATALYAACLSAICGGHYQLTAQGGASNGWLSTTITAGAPDGAFGAPAGAAVIAGNLATRTFARAVVLVNLSFATSVTYAGGAIPGGGTYAGGTLAAGGALIVQGAGYGATNTDGMFPQRGGIFWGQTTAANLLALGVWKTWVGNNSQTEGPTDGVNSPTPVASWRAARAAAVPSNPSGRFLESHNGLGVYVDGSGNPNVYWPVQQRVHAFCQLDPTHRWIQEGGSPLQVAGGVGGTSTVRLFDIRNDALQEFLANEVQASVARCGADGAFGDEWHAIHPLRGALHPGVPQDVDQLAGMVRLCEIMASHFDDATTVTAPAPAVAGTVQTATLSGLTPATKHYVALRATDDAGNVSILSNVASATTLTPPDTTPPPAVADLAVVAHGQTTVTLEWSPPMDDLSAYLGFVPVASYDLRRSTSLITSGNFSSATPVAGVPAPADVDLGPQGLDVTGLAPGTTYWFALKSTDASGNVSAISNVATVTTDSAAPPPDTTAPAAISDLALPVPLRTTTTLGARWTATGNDGAVGTAAAYDLRISTAAIDAGNFSAAQQVPGLPAPAAAGATETFTITGLQPSTTYFVALKARDQAGNWSAISNLPSRATAAPPADTVPPGDVVDLAVVDQYVIFGALMGAIACTFAAMPLWSITRNQSLSTIQAALIMAGLATLSVAIGQWLT